MFKIYNSLTQKKDAFKPIDPTHIKMYVCGPTVYDDIHIGNARPIVVFDTIYKTLQAIYQKVTYVRNITDVDDKIIERAKFNQEPINSLTQRTTEDFHSVIQKLNAQIPTFEPKATDNIKQMQDIIQSLLDKNFAYISNSHVIFDTTKYDKYGALSNLSLDDLQHGARIQINDIKTNPSDFILWKPSNKNEVGWQSPWGYGRPGWHIECSAMAKRYLGNTFDIHGGGKDLIFPHHENEIAQSTCANHAPLANYWIHNGWVMVEGQKMSKSLGNFITLKQIVKTHSPEAVRLTLLSTHYKQPLDFKESTLLQSKNILDKMYNVLKEHNYNPEIKSEDTMLILKDSAFLKSMLDDINTPLAIQELQQEVSLLNSNNSNVNLLKIKHMAHLLGILQQTAKQWFQQGISISKEEIDALIQQRTEAKANKNYALADRIRQDLLNQAIMLEDTKNGTSWKKV